MATNTRNSVRNVLNAAVSDDYQADFNYAVSLTVPGTTDKDIPLTRSVKEFFDGYIIRQMSEIFGGCTATQGNGYWRDANGTLVSERVTVVTALAVIDDTAESVERLIAVRNLASTLKDILKQDCVLLSIQPVTAAYFI